MFRRPLLCLPVFPFALRLLPRPLFFQPRFQFQRTGIAAVAQPVGDFDNQPAFGVDFGFEALHVYRRLGVEVGTAGGEGKGKLG